MKLGEGGADVGEGVGVTIIGRCGRSLVSWVTRCWVGRLGRTAAREKRRGICYVTCLEEQYLRLEQAIEIFVERYWFASDHIVLFP